MWQSHITIRFNPPLVTPTDFLHFHTDAAELGFDERQFQRSESIDLCISLPLCRSGSSTVCGCITPYLLSCCRNESRSLGWIFDNLKRSRQCDCCTTTLALSAEGHTFQIAPYLIIITGKLDFQCDISIYNDDYMLEQAETLSGDLLETLCRWQLLYCPIS